MSSITAEALIPIGGDVYVPPELMGPKLNYRLWQDGNQGTRIRGRVEAFPGDTLAQYYTMATQALYYYDYFLTLLDEVLPTLHPPHNSLTAVQIKYAWMGKKTWSVSCTVSTKNK